MSTAGSSCGVGFPQKYLTLGWNVVGIVGIVVLAALDNQVLTTPGGGSLSPTRYWPWPS